MLLAGAMWVALYAAGQELSQTTSLHGSIHDEKGNPAVRVVVWLRRKGSSDSNSTYTDSQGSYSFTNLQDGIYSVDASQEGSTAHLDPVFLKPHESKTLDLILAPLPQGKASATTVPQFFDQPQFTVAGVTDTTNLGGHGSDTVVRTRDSLARETVSLSETAAEGRLDVAQEKSLRDAAQRQPTDFNANHELGQFLLGGGRAREAIPFLDRAAERNPSNYQNLLDLARANAEAGNYSMAREQATKLLATHDQSDLHHLVGDIEEKLGDSLEAVRHYQRAAELDPSESHLFDWGAELLLHHAPEPAAEVFSKGTQKYPSSSRMLLGLGAASFARGNTDDAIRRICQASDLNPPDVRPYLFLGKIEQSEITPPDDLVNRLHRFATLQPQNADANFYFAVGLWKQRKTSQRIDILAPVEFLLNNTLKIDPKYAPAELQLGIVHADLGEYAQAASDYKKALDSDPQLEEAHYRLAQAYRQIGESDKAKEELRIYGELAKESAQKQDRERREIKQFVYTLRDQSTLEPH